MEEWEVVEQKLLEPEDENKLKYTYINLLILIHVTRGRKHFAL